MSETEQRDIPTFQYPVNLIGAKEPHNMFVIKPPVSGKEWNNIICTMVGVKIKGTACGLYNVVPLSGHSLHKLQPIYSQLGSYTTLGQLYHALAVIP